MIQSRWDWTLDVLNIVRRLGQAEFKNEDVYAFDRELEKLHPDKRSLRTATRQNPPAASRCWHTATVRDAGLLLHLGSGIWRLP